MRRVSIWMLAFCVSVLPNLSTSLSAAPKDVRVPVRNVELSAKGTVTGVLIDAQKKPLVSKAVAVHTRDGVAQVKTDAKGRFTVASAKGGPCKIVVDDRAYVCRLWTDGTAPPKSLTAVGLVHSPGYTVRGQDDQAYGDDGLFGNLGGVSGGQLLGLALLGGAVTAIVIAANNDDDAS